MVFEEEFGCLLGVIVLVEVDEGGYVVLFVGCVVFLFVFVVLMSYEFFLVMFEGCF